MLSKNRLTNNMNDEIKELMDEYDLDKHEAEGLQDLMDETGLDPDDANELREVM